MLEYSVRHIGRRMAMAAIALCWSVKAMAAWIEVLDPGAIRIGR